MAPNLLIVNQSHFHRQAISIQSCSPTRVKDYHLMSLVYALYPSSQGPSVLHYLTVRTLYETCVLYVSGADLTLRYCSVQRSLKRVSLQEQSTPYQQSLLIQVESI